MELKDLEIENYSQKKIWISSFSLSIIFHLLIFLALIYFYETHSNKSKINSAYFTLDTKQYIQHEANTTEKMIDEKTLSEKHNTTEKDGLKTISFSNISADTTNLDQVYSEPTLNVSIKYPKGWTFIDQDKHNKLDGVTFWESNGLYNPPPYFHIEVVDKDMFIEKRYIYKIDLNKYLAYYNEPEEMQGYVTQVVYLRTTGDEDFQIKLMMKGETEFKSFLPRFWAILKSFKFGNSLF